MKLVNEFFLDFIFENAGLEEIELGKVTEQGKKIHAISAAFETFISSGILFVDRDEMEMQKKKKSH